MTGLKALTRRVIDEIFRRQGFEIVRLGWEPKRLRKDIRIQTLIDVGVGVGQGTPVLYEAYPDARLLLVEPNPQSWPYMDRILTNREGQSAKLAAAKDRGKMVFQSYPAAPELSSFVKREDLGHLEREEIEVEVKPLDEVVQDSGLPGPYGIKIDTEGFELAVLEGACETLAQAEFVLLESTIAPDMDPTYTQAEIFGFLERNCFYLCDIIAVGYEHAGLRVKQADFFFKRKPQ